MATYVKLVYDKVPPYLETGQFYEVSEESITGAQYITDCIGGAHYLPALEVGGFISHAQKGLPLHGYFCNTGKWRCNKTMCHRIDCTDCYPDKGGSYIAPIGSPTPEPPAPEPTDGKGINTPIKLISGEYHYRNSSGEWHRLYDDNLPLTDTKASEPTKEIAKEQGISTDSQVRKDSPVFSGFCAYFPHAMFEVARLSKIGNDKHNPGEPLHWSKGKSNDHGDCIVRHQLEFDKVDQDTGLLHAVSVAWRAMAQLETLLTDRD